MSKTDESAGFVHVRVVFVAPGVAFDRSLRLPVPATVAAAIAASGLRSEVALPPDGELALGVFGERRALADPLHDGDRVEIYRPLAIDPKQARRLRVAARRQKKNRPAQPR